MPKDNMRFRGAPYGGLRWPALVVLIIAACAFTFVWAAARSPRKRIVMAYERIPQSMDGAELYLLDVLRALGEHVDITFVARAASGRCAPSPVDVAALKAALPGPPHVILRDASVGSGALERALGGVAAVVLPVSVLEDTCGNVAGNATRADSAAEVYVSAIQRSRDGASIKPPRIVVFTFDAHAARARSLALSERNAGQAARYAFAAEALAAREAALYSRADALVVLTAEDAADTPPAREPTRVVQFRFSLPPPGLLLPGWRHRSGFIFIGSGDNPTNSLALQTFLLSVWPQVRQHLPSAQLHVVGKPPQRLCAAYGVWCDGWLSDTPLAADKGAGAGVIVHGLVPDAQAVLGSARVGVAPMTCGTGVNTKVGLMMAAGVPVVGTAKAVRGYAPRTQPGSRPGAEVTVMPGVGGAQPPALAGGTGTMRSMVDALVALHEDEGEWEAAHAAALAHAAELNAAAATGGRGGVPSDVRELLRACGT
jgi:hypothetical protein